MDDADMCMDIGYCTVYAYPNITKESCLEDGGGWNADDPGCDYRFKPGR